MLIRVVCIVIFMRVTVDSSNDDNSNESTDNKHMNMNGGSQMWLVKVVTFVEYLLPCLLSRPCISCWVFSSILYLGLCWICCYFCLVCWGFVEYETVGAIFSMLVFQFSNLCVPSQMCIPTQSIRLPHTAKTSLAASACRRFLQVQGCRRHWMRFGCLLCLFQMCVLRFPCPIHVCVPICVSVCLFVFAFECPSPTQV